ncbi:MAG: GAF and ANTAR domain-containing protein, partial [Acidimicrobiales bacterium]|nr:GAF and ANTAR domain-containing protein [Acidimicrobiales bacterium]
MDAERLSRVTSMLGEVSARPVLDRFLVLVTELLSVTAAAVAVIGDGQHQGAVAVSDPGYAPVDDLQFSLGEGPCLDARRRARPVLVADLGGADGSWPAFASEAIRHGVRAVFAFPLSVGAQSLGVLSLYRDAPGPLEGGDLADAIELSHVATHLLLGVQAGLVPGTVPDRLGEILDHRAQVHQATGMIAAQLETDVATALSRLRAHAWSHDRSIDDV